MVGVAVIVAVAQAAGPVRFLPDAQPAGLGRLVLIDSNPSRLTSRRETPSAVAFLLARRWTFDKEAVKRECAPADAAAANCQRVSMVGFGHVVVHVTGYLFPGGETDGVAYMTAFLGHPVAAGDPASMVLQVRWLGADQLIAVANRYFGTRIKKKSSIIGRIIRLGSGRYGLEVRFDGFPGGIRIPPSFQSAGVSATITRFKLEIGRVRRVRRPVTRTVSTPTGTITIHDHVLIGHHLLARPSTCPASRLWPWQLVFGFPEGAQRVSGTVRCG
jgi:hypothetical protein